MPIPADVYRVVSSGKMPGGEIWSAGFWVQGALPTSSAEANITAGLWWDQLATTADPPPWQSMSNLFWSAEMALTAVSVYAYPGGGPLAEYVGRYEGSLPGLSGNPAFPNQVAMCVSLRTGLAGRRARGRLYMPINKGSLSADGNFDPSVCQAQADNWAGAFSGWNSSGDNGVVGVVSQAATSFHPVTSVIVDSRPDIQRRRANRQVIDAAKSSDVTS